MTWTDMVGYGASVLVLMTFCMRTMLRLRVVAVCSNLAFILYGLLDGIYPVLLLHLFLLPLNIARLFELARPDWRTPSRHKGERRDLFATLLSRLRRLRHAQQNFCIRARTQQPGDATRRRLASQDFSGAITHAANEAQLRGGLLIPALRVGEASLATAVLVSFMLLHVAAAVLTQHSGARDLQASDRFSMLDSD